MSPDPYQVLGVTREASAEVLKAAYRRLVRENHPDVASDKTAATTRTASINQAWQLVGDPQKRLAFDARYRLATLEREARQRETTQREVTQRETAQREAAQRERRQGVSTASGQRASTSVNGTPIPNRRAVPESAEASAAARATSESFSSERARLEAQRRARLEREKIEREHARRLRNSGVKTEAKSNGSKNGSRAAVATAKAAAAQKSASRPNSTADSNGARGDASREVRLRRKIMMAAQLFHRERKVDEAVALCRAVLHADGRSVAARELLGDIYLQQGRTEYALMMFDQALLIEPDHLMLRRKRDQLQNAQDLRRSSGAKLAASQLKAPRVGLLNRLKARLSSKK